MGRGEGKRTSLGRPSPVPRGFTARFERVLMIKCDPGVACEQAFLGLLWVRGLGREEGLFRPAALAPQESLLTGQLGRKERDCSQSMTLNNTDTFLKRTPRFAPVVSSQSFPLTLHKVENISSTRQKTSQVAL